MRGASYMRLISWTLLSGSEHSSIAKLFHSLLSIFYFVWECFSQLVSTPSLLCIFFYSCLPSCIIDIFLSCLNSVSCQYSFSHVSIFLFSMFFLFANFSPLLFMVLLFFLYNSSLVNITFHLYSSYIHQ